MTVTCLRTREVPWGIAVELGLLPEGLSPWQWEEEARGVVRRYFRRGVLEESGPVRYRDARVWDVIRDVLEEN